MVMAQLKPYARIVACGAIAVYKWVPHALLTDGGISADKPYGVRNTPSLVAMKAKIEGFIALDYAKRFPEARAYLADLQSKGKINDEYMVLEPKEGRNGLERFTEALESMFAGKNYGKT